MSEQVQTPNENDAEQGAVLTPEAFSRAVQNAVDGVDDLYGRISHPLARDRLLRRAVRDSIAAVVISHQELQRQVDEANGVTPPVAEEVEETTTTTPLPVPFVSERVDAILSEHGFQTIESLEAATDEQLLAIDGIGPVFLADIRDSLDILLGGE